MNNDPANRVQDYLVFGEYGGVNPSIEDSSTFTFMTADKMKEIFNHEIEGCFLYSRHLNPTNRYLGKALSLMEGSEDAKITASGMAAIACSVLQLCKTGDEIIASRTIYGGTYALLKNFLPRLGINTHFVNICDLDAVKSKINEKTKVIYTETISNPLLEVADTPELRKIADAHNCKLIVDNTFSPLILTPLKTGAHIVVHSLTKFVNGSSDCVGGAVCADADFVALLRDVNSGAAMLLGPVMDSLRSASILKNLRTLHIRIQQHSKNASFVANSLKALGIKVFYPGLEEHPQYQLLTKLKNPGYGYGGMLTLDTKTEENANRLMEAMQNESVGYFAVSLGFYKTLFSSPGSSTSSEIPKEEQEAMGMTPGLVRISVGIDQDIERSFSRIKKCLIDVGLI